MITPLIYLCQPIYEKFFATRKIKLFTWLRKILNLKIVLINFDVLNDSPKVYTWRISIKALEPGNNNRPSHTRALGRLFLHLFGVA